MNLFDVDAAVCDPGRLNPAPFKMQLLKWVGNKQRFGHELARYFPADYRCYYEPFLGAGGVLGVVAPHTAVASDAFEPLIGIWQCLHDDPALLVEWYRERWQRFEAAEDRVGAYEAVKADYNAGPNSADLLFLSRSCYGGVVRFRKDGYMSTPCGVHNPVSPASFKARVAEWTQRTARTRFLHLDYREAIDMAGDGDVVYCDPPYTDTQKILYGAQAFSLPYLFEHIEAAKARGAKVALSIDGTKKSGRHKVTLPIPDGLFAREVLVNCGVSHLRRFQRGGETLGDELVADRLLLTW
ncbi:MAG: Dam family site-specific DNA-(adenine-N6)-methyltransferase [Acidimicrobiales bacterium]